MALAFVEGRPVSHDARDGIGQGLVDVDGRSAVLDEGIDEFVRQEGVRAFMAVSYTHLTLPTN